MSKRTFYSSVKIIEYLIKKILKKIYIYNFLDFIIKKNR